MCCFVVCENFFPEIQAAVRQQGLTDVEVRSFPSHCSSAPIKWSELVDIVRSSWADTVVIFGSYCLRELGAPPEGFSRCQIHQKEQCHHLLCSPTLVDAVQQNGTYLLSPGWLSCWRRHIATWGFDRPTAMEFFGESLRKLLLLDTGTDLDSERHLAEFGSFLQLPTEILPIGLEFLGLSLSHIIADYQQQKIIRQKEEVERQAAESAMTLDLIRMVTRVKSKSEVVSAIIDLFTMLFDPKKIYFIPVSNAEVHFDQVSDLPPEEQLQAQQFYARPERYFLLNKEQGSFLLRIGRKEGTSALLLVSQVTHPLYINQYINTALAISEVCALSIKHVQTLRELVRTSHLAGKAEVATEVLHNVGNTLNSISVSSEHIRETVQQSSSTSLPDIVQLIQDHEEDRENFCTHDPRGKMLPTYFARLSGKLTEEREFLLTETTRQLHHIRRVAEIIRAQQDTAKLIDFTEQVNLTSLLEESLELFQGELDEQRITVERHYGFQQSICAEPHKILQVMNNLIRNAVDAFDGISVEEKKISLSTYPTADRDEVVVEITDNGKGMQQNILQQAFVFGFTTKKDGHGFGLHNAANLTAEMGGSLTGESAGSEQGARFRMRLPVTATGGTE
ncbi:MAG: HAMP domain-containing sensor histidine kinase [Candidatus Electrothrix communis]|nr:MAG: HAMP domain-containing sensor histidine kinase [Candidatus Electrothrix communis]